MTAAYDFFRSKQQTTVKLGYSSERQARLTELFCKFSNFNSKTRKWEHDYSVSYSGRTSSVCERVFADLHGFTKSAFEREAVTQKNALYSELLENEAYEFVERLDDDDNDDNDDDNEDEDEIGAYQSSNFFSVSSVYKDDTLHPFSVLEHEEIFSENVRGTVDMNIPEFTKCAMSPLAEKQSLCITWLDEYFKTYSDHSPNSLLSKVSLTFKQDLYNLYVKAMKGQSIPTVSYKRFLELWKVLFPYCINRPWCNVPGKCETCFMIQQARGKSGLDQRTSLMLQQCHAIHRGGLFMLERAKYKERILYALADKTKRMSIIIDGMDQSHCQCPYFGQTHTFSSPITQHITGVKEHGHGVTIYRTLGTVSKGANLTIYCILSQLEKFKKRNGKYPEEFLVQLDGGSENANQYVLGMLEFLVYQRLIKKIHFTRLPTGHTHEDIGTL